MKKLATLSVIASAVLWGLMGLFVRRLNAAGIGSLEIIALRVSFGALVIGLYLALTNREKLRIRLRDLWCFLGTGLCSILFFSYCYFRTMTLTSLSVAGILLYTAPVFVMLLSVLLFRERVTVAKVAALICAVAGCALVSGIGGGTKLSGAGLLLGLGAGFGYALYSIFGRYAVNRGYDFWTITFYSFLICALGCIPLAKWSVIGAAVAADASLIGWIVAMGAVTAVGAYLLYTWGLQYIESSRASILASVEPVVATMVGVVAFDERLTVTGVLGIVAVLAAIVIMSLKLRRAASKPAAERK